jgi:hypothetical protein
MAGRGREQRGVRIGSVSHALHDPGGNDLLDIVANREPTGEHVLAELGVHLACVLNDLTLCKLNMLAPQRDDGADAHARQVDEGDQRPVPTSRHRLVTEDGDHLADLIRRGHRLVWLRLQPHQHPSGGRKPGHSLKIDFAAFEGGEPVIERPQIGQRMDDGGGRKRLGTGLGGAPMHPVGKVLGPRLGQALKILAADDTLELAQVAHGGVNRLIAVLLGVAQMLDIGVPQPLIRRVHI